MQSSFASARRHQIVFAVLLAICLAQVGWWMIDQWLFSTDVRQRLEDAHRRDLEAARVLIERGAGAEQIVELFPHLVIGADGDDLEVDPALVDSLREERASRLNRYAWEGGFFLLVLSAAISVLWRAARTEMRLRRRQHNFVTAVTHELKTPLASVRLAAETLEYREADEATRRRLVHRLLRSLDRMDVTVSNILETARVDEGKLELAPEPVELAACVGEVFDALGPAAAVNDVDLEFAGADGLTVYADPRAIATVLRNLVANAIESSAGADGAKVAVSGERVDGSVRVDVRDNGRGFAPADGEKLFDKFYRLGDEMQRRGRGTGLGLYIARALVNESGGDLTAESSGSERGAVFRATWPAEPPAAGVNS